jgi:hypothetical protein
MRWYLRLQTNNHEKNYDKYLKRKINARRAWIWRNDENGWIRKDAIYENNDQKSPTSF